MKRSFLIVDDDLDDQELFCEAVAEIDPGISCTAVSSCEEALVWLRDGDEPLPDLIFLDLNMPRLNGKQCLAELKRDERLRSIPVIIYSTSSEQRDREETFALGAVHFLTKPHRFEELYILLKAAITTDWKNRPVPASPSL